MKKTRILALLLAGLWGGCATTPYKTVQDLQNEERASASVHVAEWVARRESYLQTHSELSPAIAEAIRTGDLVRGMTQDQVLMSWRTPNRVFASGNIIQWTYEDRSGYAFATESLFRSAGFGPPKQGTVFVYFRSGVLVDWQIALGL